jgi:hypothetical protein
MVVTRRLDIPARNASTASVCSWLVAIRGATVHGGHVYVVGGGNRPARLRSTQWYAERVTLVAVRHAGVEHVAAPRTRWTVLVSTSGLD